MQAGMILFHRKMVFADGASADKYLVVLGVDEKVVVTAKTTSKGHHYRNDHGCQSGNRFAAFLLTQGCCCLRKNTWVCLSEFYEFRIPDLQSLMVSGDIFKFGLLDNALTRDVQVCAAGCDDISRTHEGLVRASFV